MNAETELELQAIDPELTAYDAQCKKVFSNKEVLAPLLLQVVPEYSGCTLDEVISCIDAASIKSSPVSDTAVTVDLLNGEQSAINEKIIRYDAFFRAVNPKRTTEQMQFYLYIDVEVQNTYRPGNPAYPIVSRGIYYAARALSSQLGTIKAESNYGDLQKVYSIWICNEDVPKAIQNTVSSYAIRKSDVIGITDEPETDYDLMNVIIIRRGEDVSKESVFDYLSSIFKSDLERASKYIDMNRSPKMKEVILGMSGMGATIYQRGTANGIAIGQVQGKFDAMLDLVYDGILTVPDAARRTSMSEAEFRKKMAEVRA